MKKLVYQYWNGDVPPGARASFASVAAYAKRIGASHRADENGNWSRTIGGNTRQYDMLRPVFDDEFGEYDKVLFLDADIFAVDGVADDIFEIPVGDMGICVEPHQPGLRASMKGGISAASDEKWAAAMEKKWGMKLPRDGKGRLLVYNSGVVMYTRKGIGIMRKRFVTPSEYLAVVPGSLHNLYRSDQNYLHAMMFKAGLDFAELSTDWNSIVHFLGSRSDRVRPVHDGRGPDAKFVHIQLSNADHWRPETLWRVANLGQGEWRL